MTTLASYAVRQVGWQVAGGVATLMLNRPERKNPLTFDAYAALRDLFRALALADDVKAVVVTGAGDNFCSGGDVHDIIGPLTRLDMPGLLAFTRMTGDVVKAMRACEGDAWPGRRCGLPRPGRAAGRGGLAAARRRHPARHARPLPGTRKARAKCSS
jgi:hypothetical protein